MLEHSTVFVRPVVLFWFLCVSARAMFLILINDTYMNHSAHTHTIHSLTCLLLFIHSLTCVCRADVWCLAFTDAVVTPYRSCLLMPVRRFSLPLFSAYSSFFFDSTCLQCSLSPSNVYLCCTCFVFVAFLLLLPVSSRSKRKGLDCHKHQPETVFARPR